jgi:subtilisin-like proprotein convertase family protein
LQIVESSSYDGAATWLTPLELTAASADQVGASVLWEGGAIAGAPRPSRDIGGFSWVWVDDPAGTATLRVGQSFNPRTLYATFFFEDFEAGVPSDWTATSDVTDITWSSRSDPVPPGSTACVSFWDGVGSYASSEGTPVGLLTTPAIMLPVSSGIRVFFDSAYETEDLDPIWYDTRVVYVYDATTMTVIKTLRLASEDMLTWHRYEFDLTDLAGTSIVIGFSFDAVDSAFNDFTGWMVDNLRVSSATSGTGIAQVTLTDPLAIPDGTAIGTSSALTISDSAVVETVQVFVDVAHDDLSQVSVILISPSGTEVALHGFADGANLYGIYGADLTPVDLLEIFDGEDSLGVWTLKVVDTVSGTTGTVNGWRLILNR